MPLISFYCLIALTGSSSTILNRINKSDIFVLYLTLGGKQSLTMKYDVSCGGFVDVLYQFEGVPFYFTFVECFHYEGMLNFYEVLFL